MKNFSSLKFKGILWFLCVCVCARTRVLAWERETHSVVWLTTGPCPLSKQVLRSVCCSASALIVQYLQIVLCGISCSNTPSPPPSGGPKGGVIYLWIVFSVEGAFHIYLCFWKRQPRKSNTVVVFPFAFHITVQQSLQPLLSCLLLCDREPSWASIALCFKALLILLLLASEELGVPFSKASLLVWSLCSWSFQCGRPNW